MNIDSIKPGYDGYLKWSGEELEPERALMQAAEHLAEAAEAMLRTLRGDENPAGPYSRLVWAHGYLLDVRRYAADCEFFFSEVEEEKEEVQRPKVLNLRNTNGVLPDGAVYVGRAMPRYGLAASKFANPFKVDRDWDPEWTGQGSRLWAVEEFETHLHTSGLIEHVGELRGKDLACWCAPELCHANVLMRLANADESDANVIPDTPNAA